jgi:peptidoglycan hydrolase-like protein with peptidoglycan-binding domain
MAGVRTTLLILLAAGTLVVGCQTAPGPSASDAGSARPAPPVRESTPAAATAPKAGGDLNNQGARSEPLAAPMSTAELQRRLTELAYKPGPIDGVAGPRTTNALKKFQLDHRLPVTGTLDAETIRELRKP